MTEPLTPSKTTEVTELFEGQLTREKLAEAIKAVIVPNIVKEQEYIYEWHFDEDAAHQLLEVTLEHLPLDEELKDAALKDGIMCLHGRSLQGWKVNIMPACGFRVEVCEYEVTS